VYVCALCVLCLCFVWVCVGVCGCGGGWVVGFNVWRAVVIWKKGDPVEITTISRFSENMQ